MDASGRHGGARRRPDGCRRLDVDACGPAPRPVSAQRLTLTLPSSAPLLVPSLDLPWRCLPTATASSMWRHRAVACSSTCALSISRRRAHRGHGRRHRPFLAGRAVDRVLRRGKLKKTLLREELPSRFAMPTGPGELGRRCHDRLRNAKWSRDDFRCRRGAAKTDCSGFEEGGDVPQQAGHPPREQGGPLRHLDRRQHGRAAHRGPVSFHRSAARLSVKGACPRYAPTGHLVFVRDDESLMAAPFDLDRLEVTGPPSRWRKGFAWNNRAVPRSTRLRRRSLVYLASDAGRSEATLVWVDRRGKVEPLTSERHDFGSRGSLPMASGRGRLR